MQGGVFRQRYWSCASEPESGRGRSKVSAGRWHTWSVVGRNRFWFRMPASASWTGGGLRLDSLGVEKYISGIRNLSRGSFDEESATKSNVAYDRARRDIVTGVIAANEALDETALGAVRAGAYADPRGPQAAP